MRKEQITSKQEFHLRGTSAWNKEHRVSDNGSRRYFRSSGLSSGSILNSTQHSSGVSPSRLRKWSSPVWYKIAPSRIRWVPL